MIALPDWVTPDPDESAGVPFTALQVVFPVAIGSPLEFPAGEELFSVSKSIAVPQVFPGTVVLEGRVFTDHLEMWHWFKDGSSACLYKLPGKFTTEDFPKWMLPHSTGMEEVTTFMMGYLEKKLK